MLLSLQHKKAPFTVPSSELDIQALVIIHFDDFMLFLSGPPLSHVPAAYLTFTSIFHHCIPNQ